jgi:hypothetical protein
VVRRGGILGLRPRIARGCQRTDIVRCLSRGKVHRGWRRRSSLRLELDERPTTPHTSPLRHQSQGVRYPIRLPHRTFRLLSSCSTSCFLTDPVSCSLLRCPILTSSSSDLSVCFLELVRESNQNFVVLQVVIYFSRLDYHTPFSSLLSYLGPLFLISNPHAFSFHLLSILTPSFLLIREEQAYRWSRAVLGLVL